MKALKFGIVALVIGLSSACKKEEVSNPTPTDYLIFGHFYGMCAGEQCIETFKLTDQSLLEDTIDDYTGQNLVFVPLGNDKFDEVKDLLDYFPSQLRNETSPVLGCPDCADGGGLVIHLMEDGNLRSWRIDQVQSNVPGYLHGFMDKVNEKIALINK